MRAQILKIPEDSSLSLEHPDGISKNAKVKILWGIILLNLLLCGFCLFICFLVYIPSPDMMHLRASCKIPYEFDSFSTPLQCRNEYIGHIDWRKYLFNFFDRFQLYFENKSHFLQDIEIYHRNNESYIKVGTSNLVNKSSGNFIHDFMHDLTVLIDIKADICFYMALETEIVAAPLEFMEQLLLASTRKRTQKLVMRHITRDMFIVFQKLDMYALPTKSVVIENACKNRRSYTLMDIEFFHTHTHMVDDDIHLDIDSTFAEFMGKGIVEYNIANYGKVFKMKSQERERVVNDNL